MQPGPHRGYSGAEGGPHQGGPGQPLRHLVRSLRRQDRLRPRADFLLGQTGGHSGRPQKVTRVGLPLPSGLGVKIASSQPAYEVISVKYRHNIY